MKRDRGFESGSTGRDKETALSQTKKTAFRQWRATSVLTLSPQAGVNNLLDTCGAIKERKTAFPAPHKKLSAQPKQPLDRKSPIQVRIPFPPAESRVRT
jgi:hypothetical protein